MDSLEKKKTIEEIRRKIQEYIKQKAYKNEEIVEVYYIEQDVAFIQYSGEFDKEKLTHEIREQIRQHSTSSPKEKLVKAINRFMQKKGIEKPSEIYSKCGMQRQLFSKVISPTGTAIPKKRTLLQLAIGLRLNVLETEYLLRTVGFAFPVDVFDEVIKLCIEHGLYDYKTINKILEEEIQDSFTEKKKQII